MMKRVQHVGISEAAPHGSGVRLAEPGNPGSLVAAMRKATASGLAAAGQAVHDTARQHFIEIAQLSHEPRYRTVLERGEAGPLELT